MNRIAAALSLSVLLAACGGSRPTRPTRVEVARQLLRRDLGGGLGRPSTGYCRPDLDGSYACVMRTPRGRVTCVVSLDRAQRIQGTYCNRPG